MKISIELDIGPDEVSLATELLNTLRLITAQVGQASPPALKDPKQLLKALLAKLPQETDESKVVSNIVGVLDSYNNPSAAIAEFVEAFVNEAFDPRHIAAQQPMAPYFSVLNNKLPEHYNKEVRKSIISKVLAHMTRKRPVDVNRVEFILQAEAFACLVKMECVQAEGAVQTMEKLLKPDTRAAAITMLGKTLDLCPEKVASAKPQFLNKLWSSLDQVTEPSFQYDLSFILTCKQQIMGQPPMVTDPMAAAAAAAAAAASMPPASAPMPLPMSAPMGAASTFGQPLLAAPAAATLEPVRGFYAHNAWHGHENIIFCLGWDPVTRCAFSGGKESSVLVWDQAGTKKHTIPIPGYCTAAIDCHKRGNFIGLCGMPEDGSTSPPVMALFDGTQGSWKSRCMSPRPNASLISTIRFLMADTDTFITSETGVDGSNAICFWDLARAGGGEPVHVYREHQTLTAAVGVTAAHPNLVITGAQDGTMLVFDVRAPTSVGTLGVADAATGVVRGHSSAITCVDAMGDIVLSTGIDSHVNVWDLKMMQSSAAGGAKPTVGPIASILVEPTPDVPIFKVAYANSPRPTLAAFASVNSLNLLDWSTSLATPQLIPCTNFNDPNIAGLQYHEIKWAPGASMGAPGAATLLAASEKPYVAAFSVV